MVSVRCMMRLLGLPHAPAATSIAVVFPSPDSLLQMCVATALTLDDSIITEAKLVNTMYWCSSMPGLLKKLAVLTHPCRVPLLRNAGNIDPVVALGALWSVRSGNISLSPMTKEEQFSSVHPN